MIDIKIVRETPEILIDNLIKRGSSKEEANSTVEKLLGLDKQLKDTINKTENLQAERNRLSKSIGQLKAKGEDVTPILQEVEKSKKLEAELEGELKAKKTEFNDYILTIPNILDASVPVGGGEDENKIIRTFGEPIKFNFTPKAHDDIGVELGLMDFKAASKLSGSRFVVLKNELSRLERAISNFMLDVTTQKGFTECSVPLIVNSNALLGTGQLPKFSDDMFKIANNNDSNQEGINNNDKWLISTSEIALTNLVQDSIIDSKELPIRLTSLTNCFRSEAGSAGKDTKGILRQHQFLKVEMVSICPKEKGEEELEFLTSTAEDILQKLEIPYRVMLLCSGDTGFSSSKTYDIEVWVPSQNTYREISSCSWCTDFQARRMKARSKNKGDKQTTLVNTLNGSALAVGRTMLAIMENYQQEDGSIKIPSVLIPYMGGIDIINKK